MSTQIIDLRELIFQGADDVDYVNTHPEIVRVPDPEILMVFIKNDCFFQDILSTQFKTSA